MEINFTGKVALVTGAGSGLGLLSAKCFAKEGAKVVLVDINEDAINTAAEEIKKDGGDAIAVKVDITKYDEVKASCDKAIETYGAVDILVTCAGGSEMRLRGVGDKKFYDVPIDVLDFGIDLNLKGAMYYHHALMPQMIKQCGGVIIPLGSITGQEGGHFAYSAAKSALMNGVVKSLALAGEQYNVRAVCVAPGPVLTRPGMAGMRTMAGRAADPQEIVDMILFVASDRGAFLNGTTILMDGGRNVMFNKNGPQQQPKTKEEI